MCTLGPGSPMGPVGPISPSSPWEEEFKLSHHKAASFLPQENIACKFHVMNPYIILPQITSHGAQNNLDHFVSPVILELPGLKPRPGLGPGIIWSQTQTRFGTHHVSTSTLCPLFSSRSLETLKQSINQHQPHCQLINLQLINLQLINLQLSNLQLINLQLINHALTGSPGNPLSPF